MDAQIFKSIHYQLFIRYKFSSIHCLRQSIYKLALVSTVLSCECFLQKVDKSSALSSSPSTAQVTSTARLDRYWPAVAAGI